jgi:PAS domain S-box-containing protein
MKLIDTFRLAIVGICCSQLLHSADVLLLNSYHYGLPWTDGITTAVAQKLSEEGVEFSVEYMDSKRRSYGSVKEGFSRYLAEKYTLQPPKVVIVSDNNALALLVEYRDVLFEDSKIVFCGINDYSDELINGIESRVSGVIEQTDPVGTLALMLEMQPELERVYVVSGDTPTGNALQSFTKSQIEKSDLPVEVSYWSDLTLKALADRSSKLGSKEAILLLTFNKDSEGNYYSYAESATAVTQGSAVPVYSLWDFYLGTGIVGGRIISSESQGKTAAAMVLEYLRIGVLPDRVDNSPNQSIILYDEVIRYGIDPTRIPPEVLVINRPSQQQNDIWIIIIVVLAMSLALLFVANAVFSSFQSKNSKVQLAQVLRKNSVATLGMTVFMIIAVLVFFKLRDFNSESDEIEQNLIQGRKELIKSKVEALSGEVESLHAAYPNNSAERTAMLTFYLYQRVNENSDPNQYFFVLDGNGAVIIHPYLPDLVGKNLQSSENDREANHIRELLSIASNPEGGYLNYQWQRAGAKRFEDKLAFVKPIQHTEWVLGFAVFMDDLADEVRVAKEELKQQLLLTMAAVLASALLAFLTLLGMSRKVERWIHREIDLLNQGISSNKQHMLNRNFGIAEFDSIASHAVRVFKEMQFSQEKSTKTFQYNSEMMVLVGAQSGNIVEVNRAFLSLTKCKENEILGKSLQGSGFFDGERFLGFFNDCLAGKLNEPREATFVDIDGNLHYAEINTQLIDAAGQKLVLFVFHDITKRKSAEEKVQLLSRAIDQSPVSVVITDKEGQIEYVNPKFCEVTGYTSEEAIGQNPRVLKGGETPDTVYKDLWSKITNGEQWVGEFHNRKKNGELYWESATISGVRSEAGEVTHFLAVKEDITEKRLLQTQLLHAQKLESVGQLAAGIAHEINTPIQFIGDNLQFLNESVEGLFSLTDRYLNLIGDIQNGDDPVEKAEKSLESFEELDYEFVKEELPMAINQSIDGTARVSRIVKAMKEFSHPDSEVMESVNLNKAIETNVTVTRNEWKYVTDLDLDLEPDLPDVPCLPGEFNQVMLNLIINARDAIESTGKHGRISIKTVSDERQVKILISDTGTGIPKDVVERVFDPFFTTKEVGKGTGQGLSIAHSVIVKKHGGSIDVVETSDQGTTFEICLPLQQKRE